MGDGRRNLGGINYTNPAEGVHQEYSGGGAHAKQIDEYGNTLGGAFVLGDQGSDLTGTAASQFQAIPANTSYILFDVITAECRIKIGATGTTVTATTGTRFNVGDRMIVQIPEGADGFAYIGNTSSINWTPQ